MAVVKTTRRGWFGLRRTTTSGPSSDGTKAAFRAGEKAHKKAGGATPGLKRAVAMHKANTSRTICPAR
jgi:hypothetical protein